MKNILLTGMALSVCSIVLAQDFSKSIASAKSAYGSGNLEDTRFNLENALHEIDVAIGREVLKVLPTSLETLAFNVKEDNVTGMSSSFAGLYVHRTYGNPQSVNASIELISDSPLMAGVNAILTMPAVMNSANTGQKVIKIQGYKSLLTRQEDENGGTSGYQVQTPFGNSMLTLNYEGEVSEAVIIKLANTIPLEKIIKIAQ